MGWYSPTGEVSSVPNKRQVAPFFTIVAKNADEILPNLLNQTYQDWNIAHWTDQDGLTDFSCSVSQYCLLVMNNRIFNESTKDSKFILRLVLLLLRYDIAYARIGFPVAGIVFNRRHFVGRGKFVKSVNLVHDLYKFYRSVSSNLAQIDLADPKSKPVHWNEPVHNGTQGWRIGPNNLDHNVTTTLKYLSSPPEGICIRPGEKYNSFLWTCLSNEYYEHASILRKYVGLEAEIQITGKLQHGWQTETGFDGEQGYKDEIRVNRLQALIWNRRNLENCQREGIDHATSIGAPFIYRDNGDDPGPAENKLLVLPHHSVPEYQIYSDWKKFSEETVKMAQDKGFSGVTICLHHFDYTNDNVLNAVKSSGALVVSIGGPLAERFMDRCVDLIRYHAAVASDRVSSAGLYSMMLNRPFFVYGEPLENPDPMVGLGANRKWLKDNMPSVLEFTGQADKELADRELGMEFKKDKKELQDLLWGYVL
jgi:hypothetical protein